MDGGRLLINHSYINIRFIITKINISIGQASEKRAHIRIYVVHNKFDEIRHHHYNRAFYPGV